MRYSPLLILLIAKLPLLSLAVLVKGEVLPCLQSAMVAYSTGNLVAASFILPLILPLTVPVVCASASDEKRISEKKKKKYLMQKL